ncbi:AraC family transcriptional regulator [Paenibacillus urinalis]|uniref:AraC family transcriptional regulator n=1 Tax=Paenibacillus urinalis TaxID=521520 RepID=A0ABY7X5A6_9BACL|nr:AraC family transcriptional regulator [Paenibacillus urinalis]WDH97052.1 AraC family transcriptional regulator [Paenibacillus urinalis]WDI00714.1 AraC family transcriptional regulator [Paenibacillus urinalis]
MNKVQLNWFTLDEEFPFFIQYGGHDEDTTLHRHNEFSELVIVLQGHANHIVNNEVSFIKKGHVFVINGETVHGYKDPQDFRICNIMYKADLLTYIGSDLNASKGYQALFVLEPLYRNIQSNASKLYMSLTNLDYVTSILTTMIDEYENKQQGYKTMLISRFMELVVHLSRHYENNDTDTGGHVMHLAAAVSYIEDHYLEPITLEEVAAHADVSVRHLNRIFKSYYQTSPMAYLQRLRLERACQLLRLTRLPITEISYQSGFNDSNYFARQFKKAYGFSPKAFRQSDSS